MGELERFLLFLLASLSLLQGVRGLDCTDKAAIQRAQERCFAEVGIDLGTHVSQIKDVIQKDPEAACRNPENYSAAMRCAMGVAKNCLLSVGQSVDILPDAEKMTDGLSYLCTRVDQVDLRCVQNKQEPLQHCAMARALSAFSGASTLDIKDITCKAFEIAVECVHEELHGCSGRTETIYAHFTHHYLTPPACNNHTHHADPGYHFSTPAPLTTVQLLVSTPILPDIRCYDQRSIQRGQRECFEREGIHLHVPDLTSGSSVQDKKDNYISAVLNNNKDIHTVCRRLDSYQRAMGCAMDVGRKCMPAGYKDYLPTSHNMHRMLAYICQNPDDLNQECVTSKASDLFDCGLRKGLQTRSRDPKAILCNAFSWSMECVKEVLPSCGCKTTRAYTHIYKEMLNPPACPPIPASVPECRPLSDLFVSDMFGTSGKTTPQKIAVFLLLAVLTVFFVN